MAGKKSGTKRKTRWRTLSMDDGNVNGTGNCVTNGPTSNSQKTFKNSLYTTAKVVSTTGRDSPTVVAPASSNYEDKHNDNENMRNNINIDRKRSNYKSYHNNNNNYQYNNHNSINKKYYKYNNTDVTNGTSSTTVGTVLNSGATSTTTTVPSSSYRNNQHKYFNYNNNNELVTETTRTPSSSSSTNYHYNNNNYYYKRRPFYHNNYNSANKYVLNKNVSDNDKEKVKATDGSSTTDDTKTTKPTFNEDEYTRITTPRQDVLFKKGYLSRPKTYLLNATTTTAQPPTSLDNHHIDVNYSSSGPVSVTSTEDSTLPSTQSVTPEHRNSANDMLNNFNDFAYMYPGFVDPNGSFFYINPYLSNGFDSYTGQMIMMPYGANTPLNNTVTSLDNNNNNAKGINDVTNPNDIVVNLNNEEDVDKINHTNPIINSDKSDDADLTDKVLIENTNENLTEISINSTDCKKNDLLTETVEVNLVTIKDQSNLDTSTNLNENIAADDAATTNQLNNPINPNIDNDTLDFTPYYPQYFNPYMFRQAQVFGINGMGYNDAFVNYGVPYDDSTYSRQYRYKKRKRRTRRPINSVGGTTSDYSDDESIENNNRYYNGNFVNTCTMSEQINNDVINTEQKHYQQADTVLSVDDNNLEIPNNDLVIKKSQLNVEVKEFLPRNYNKVENKIINDNIDKTLNVINNDKKENAFNEENIDKILINNNKKDKQVIKKEINTQNSCAVVEKTIKKKNINKIIKDDKKITVNNVNHKTYAQILHNKIQMNENTVKVQLNDKITTDNNNNNNSSKSTKTASIKASPKWQTVRNKKHRGKHIPEDNTNETFEQMDNVLQEEEKQSESELINHSESDECITIVEVINEVDLHNNLNNNSTAVITDTKANNNNNKLLNKNTNNKKIKSKHNNNNNNKKQTTNGCLIKKLQGFEVIEPNFNKSPLKKKTELNIINISNNNNNNININIDNENDDIIDDKLYNDNFYYNNNKEINNINNNNNVIIDNNNSSLLTVDDDNTNNTINNIVIDMIKNSNIESDNVIVDETNINVINENNNFINDNDNAITDTNNILNNNMDNIIIEENFIDKTLFLNENINEITDLITQIELNELDIENIIINEKNDDKILTELNNENNTNNELIMDNNVYCNKNQLIENNNNNLSIMNAVTKWLDDEKKKDISEPIFRLPNDPFLLKLINLSSNINYNDSTDDDDDNNNDNDNNNNIDDDDDDNFTNSTETDTDYDDDDDDLDSNDKLIINNKKIKSSNDNNNIITLPLDTDSDYMSDTQIKNDGCCLPKKEKININNDITSNFNHYQNTNNNNNTISNKRHITNSNNNNNINNNNINNNENVNSLTKTKAIKNQTLDVLTNTFNNIFTFTINENKNNDLIVEQINNKNENINNFSKAAATVAATSTAASASASLLVDNSNSSKQQQQQMQKQLSSPKALKNEQRCVLM